MKIFLEEKDNEKDLKKEIRRNLWKENWGKDKDWRIRYLS